MESPHIVTLVPATCVELPLGKCTAILAPSATEQLAPLCSTISTKNVQAYAYANCGCCEQHMMHHRCGPALRMTCCDSVVDGRCMLKAVEDRRNKKYINMICPSCKKYMSCL
jgi:hypothetical protein